MSAQTSIEWTDRTWNPVRGCSRVSEGCRNCYAERMAARFSGPGENFFDFAKQTPRGGRWTGRVELLSNDTLERPLRWRKPQRIFVNSMSDLFHESLPPAAIMAVFATMARARQHTFQVLTKRPERMRDLLSAWVRDGLTLREGYGVALPNVWLGTSVEDQATADERIPKLLQTPAAVRFISLEPQLAMVRPPLQRSQCCGRTWLSYLPGSMYEASSTYCPTCHVALSGPGTVALDWVIQGGESGPGARPFDVAWARAMRDQCKASTGVAYFLKQLGAHPYEGYLTAKETLEGERGRPRPADQPLTEAAAIEILAGDLLTQVPIPKLIRLKDRKGGDMAEWPEDLRVREFPR